MKMEQSTEIFLTVSTPFAIIFIASLYFTFKKEIRKCWKEGCCCCKKNKMKVVSTNIPLITAHWAKIGL